MHLKISRLKIEIQNNFIPSTEKKNRFGLLIDSFITAKDLLKEIVLHFIKFHSDVVVGEWCDSKLQVL